MSNIIQQLANSDFSTLLFNKKDEGITITEGKKHRVDEENMNGIIDIVTEHLKDHTIRDRDELGCVYRIMDKLFDESVKIKSPVQANEMQEKISNIAYLALLKSWNQTSTNMEEIVSTFVLEDHREWENVFKSNYTSENGDLFVHENTLYVSQAFFKRIALEYSEVDFGKHVNKEIQSKLRRFGISTIQIQGHDPMPVQEAEKLISDIISIPNHPYKMPSIPNIGTVKKPEIDEKEFYSRSKLESIFYKSDPKKFSENPQLVEKLLSSDSKIPGPILVKCWSKLSSEKELDSLLKMTEKQIIYHFAIGEDFLDNCCQTYIIRQNNWNKTYNNFDQRKYMHEMHHSVKVGSCLLKEESFNDMLIFLAARRSMIAAQSGQKSENVGRLRQDWHQPYTRFDDIYSAIPARFLENEAFFENNVTILQEGSYTCWGHIHSKKIPLQTISNDTQMVFHTDSKYIDEILDYVKTDLYPKAIDETDPTLLMEDLGTIFWWICQAKPWILGDPSIAETLIRAIWVSRGFENAPWQKGLIPWVEATVQPDVDTFAKNFYKLFEWQNQTFTESKS